VADVNDDGTFDSGDLPIPFGHVVELWGMSSNSDSLVGNCAKFVPTAASAHGLNELVTDALDADALGNCPVAKKGVRVRQSSTHSSAPSTQAKSAKSARLAPTCLPWR
jgi:hypothetical protein